MSTPSAEALAHLIQSARGTRPYSLDNRDTEQVLNIALALVVELSVSNDRIDRLERALADLKGVPVGAVREAPLAPEAQAQRDDAAAALITRALRVVLDPRTPADGRAAAIEAMGADRAPDAV